MKTALKMRTFLTRRRTRAFRVAAAAAFAFVAWLGFADACRAQGRKATLADYRGRVEQAAASVAALAALTEEAAAARRRESWARAEVSGLLPAVRERTLREVRALLPSAEQVARGDGGTLEVDNRWLYSGLAEYGRLQAFGSGNERAQALALEGLAGRLRSLAAALGELEGAPPAKRDKEAEKGRLASILRGPDFAEKNARGGALERLIDTIVKWLRDLLPEWEPIRPGPSGEASKAAQVIIYALVAAVILFVGWRYWRRRGAGAKAAPRREPRVILGERLAPDQTASDLLDEAERLARGGNLRGAIRKAYIALLCELGDRRVVRLAQHKTNRDYLQSVRESAPQTYGLFHPLTLSFERHWYGLESATEEDWDNFRTHCRRALDAQ